MSLGKETGKREGCSRKQAAEAFETAYEDGGYAVIIEEDGRKLSMKESWRGLETKMSSSVSTAKRALPAHMERVAADE